MTKKLRSNTNRCNLQAPPTPDELFVCSILIDLVSIIASSESHSFNFTWSVKRRRSSLRAEPSPQPPAQIELEKKLVKQATNGGGGGGATASPDTPLSFSPSESDEDNNNAIANNNEKHFSVEKNAKKRSREEYVGMVEELTERRDCLRGEVENVRKYYDQLVSENTKLKAVKEAVLKSHQIEETPVMQINTTLIQTTQIAQNYGNVVMPYPPMSSQIVHQQAFHPFGPVTAQFYGGLGPVNHVGPSWIPDLNVSPEEAFGMNFSQPDWGFVPEAERLARFAEARRKRRGMIKIKAMRSACGITLPRHNS